MEGLRRVACFTGSYNFNGQTLTVSPITLAHLAEVEAKLFFGCPLHIEYIALHESLDIEDSDLANIESNFRRQPKLKNVDSESVGQFLYSPNGMLFSAWQMLRHHAFLSVQESCNDWIESLIEAGWSLYNFILYRDLISGFDITTRSDAESPFEGVRPEKIAKRKLLMGKQSARWDKFFYQVSAGNYICLQDASQWTLGQYQLLCADPKSMGMDVDGTEANAGKSETKLMNPSNKRRN